MGARQDGVRKFAPSCKVEGEDLIPLPLSIKFVCVCVSIYIYIYIYKITIQLVILCGTECWIVKKNVNTMLTYKVNIRIKMLIKT